ncbi:MAG: Ty1/Copia family ribonuclease HI [bacterium]|nr:Ty1/Copia family ribonuclease HI [bacterium]
MEDFLGQCVERYMTAVKHSVKLKKADTPFLVEDQKSSMAGGLHAPGAKLECPWCKHTFPRPLADVPKASYTAKPKAKQKSKAPSPEERGALSEHAASVLMKILYAARLARFDILRAVASLACYLTKWTVDCDKRLFRLVCYINTTKHLRMIGWVGDPAANTRLHLFADADFAGCLETQRSTSGVHLALRGPRTCFPLAGQSKRQTCVSHSTPEAELVAMDFALRGTGIPALILWNRLLSGSNNSLMVHEDNQAMIQVMKSGKNPTMRHLGRTHRVSVAFLSERFAAGDVELCYETSSKMAADIYTKAFTDALKWKVVSELINLLDPTRLKDVGYMTNLLASSPSQSGGVLPPSLVLHPDGLPTKAGWHECTDAWILAKKEPLLLHVPECTRFDHSEFPYRTTWVLRNGEWSCVEKFQEYEKILEPKARIEPVSDKAIFVYSKSQNPKLTPKESPEPPALATTATTPAIDDDGMAGASQCVQYTVCDDRTETTLAGAMSSSRPGAGPATACAVPQMHQHETISTSFSKVPIVYPVTNITRTFSGGSNSLMNSFQIHFYVPSDARDQIRQVISCNSRNMSFILESVIEGWFAKYGIRIPTLFSQVLVGHQISSEAMSEKVVTVLCINDNPGIFEEGGEVILNTKGTGVISNSGRLVLRQRPGSRDGAVVLAH